MKQLAFIFIGFFLILISIKCSNPNVSKQMSNDKVRIFIAWPGYDYLPFYSWKNGDKEPTGLEVELIKAVLIKSKLDFEFVSDFYEFENDPRIDVLIKDKADISIRCISITKERNELVDFTMPYFYDGVGVLVMNSSNIKAENDLINKRIFADKYTTAYEWLTNEIKSFKYIDPQTDYYYKHTEALLDSCIVDAIVHDYSFLSTIKTKNTHYRLLNNRFTKEPWGIAVNKKRQDLLSILNTTLSSMIKSGELDSILNKYK